MPQGLQVFDASSNLIVDITDEITSVIYTAVITGAGSYTNAAFARGDIFYVVQPLQNIGSVASLQTVTVNQATNTVSWSTPSGATMSYFLVLGTY